MSVFVDVRPGRTGAGLWAIEIGQDIFQVFFISRLAQDLLDDAGGDGYSTLGGVFILPEKQSRGTNNIIIILLVQHYLGHRHPPTVVLTTHSVLPQL